MIDVESALEKLQSAMDELEAAIERLMAAFVESFSSLKETVETYREMRKERVASLNRVSLWIENGGLNHEW